MSQLLAHVPCLMLTGWFMPKETATSHSGQEECRAGSEENALQEPPLPPQGKRAVKLKLQKCIVNLECLY